jgi:hypothetical protein
MEDLIWNELPKQRVRKEEKFLTPVLTMNAVEKIGAGRRFVFNKAAQTALGIVGEERISFGFDKANNAIAVRKSDTEKSLQLTKTCTVSNKEWFEFIAKHFNLKIEVENNFDLVPTNNYFTLSLRVLDNDSNNIVTDNIESNQAMYEENPVIEFHTTQLGEISEEQDLSGDLRNIPNVETLGLDTVTESGVEGLAEQVEEEIFNVQDTEEVVETEEEDDWA